MVLHNSKWDRRAKTKYLKKHGISAADVDKNKPAEKSGPGVNPANMPKLGEPAPELEQLNTNEENANEDNSGETEEFSLDLPEFEEDEELDKLIRAHTAKQQLEQYTSLKNRPTKVADSSIFKRAAAGAERSKLNTAVRERIGRKAGAIELDSDDDFENFMDDLSEPEQNRQNRAMHAGVQIVEIDDKQQELLDKLLS